MATVAAAQAPQAFNYQAVARNVNGDPLASQSVGVQFQLHQGTPLGTVVYGETHVTTTNVQGLFNLQVGTGTVQTGVFATIDWSSGPYFMEVGLDATGGNAYTSMGNQQLLSVPYALFAQRTNCFTTSLLGDTLYQGNGCFVIIPGVSAANGGCLDLDLDGFYDRPGCGPIDCVDTDVSVNPAATELCGDGLDNDCDGAVDDLSDPLAFVLWYADADGDGFGDATSTVSACSPPTGFVGNDDDCDDADPAIFPGQGCTIFCGAAEQQWIAANQQFYLDVVQQAGVQCFGNGDPACMLDYLDNESLQGNIEVGSGCNTCAVEWWDCVIGSCLTQCIGGVAACQQCIVTSGCMATFADCVGFTDADNDGWAAQSECNDNAATIYPNAPDVCGDNLDNDCDGQVDENAPIWFEDLDLDGFGSSVSQQSCTQPAGYVQDGGDCDDSEMDLNPGANELCNGIDDNCDGQVDEGCGCTVGSVEACYSGPSGSSGIGACQQGMRTCLAGGVWGPCVGEVPPTAEICNGIDDDCDGQVDEGFNLATDTQNCGACGSQCPPGTNCANGLCMAVDLDEDGFGSDVDCDDFNAAVHPGATEQCNGMDDDCDGTIDEGLGCSVPNGVGSCVAGQCTIAFCNSGFANCDGITANGCETNISISVSNCGQCGNACIVPNANTVCVSGQCMVQSCQPGFSNCDGDSANGCETFGLCP